MRAHGDDVRWRLALAGLVVAGLGLGLFYGSMTPAFFPADERAHASYADVVRDGTLPSVDTVQPDPPPGRAPGEPLRSQDRIYVANHPPLVAAVQGGLAWGLDAVGAAPPLVVAGRIVNAAGMAVAIVVTAALGRLLSGSPAVGFWSAAAVTALPGVWPLVSFGYSDGPAVAGVVVVVWAGVRAWRSPDGRAWATLGAAVALCGLLRSSALGAAVAVTAVVVGATVLRREDTVNGERAGASDRLRRGALAGLLGLGPAALLSGWWYLRTWALTGDPVASEVLTRRLGREARPGGIPAQLANLEIWRLMASELVGTVYVAGYGPPRPRIPIWAFTVVVLVALGAIVGLVVRALPPRDRPPLVGWLVIPAAAAALVVGTASHVAGGGAPHERYLLPVLVIAAPFVVIGLDAIARWAPAAAVAALAAASLSLLPPAASWISKEAERLDLTLLAGDGWRVAAGALVVIGLLGTTSVLLASPLSGPSRRTRTAPDVSVGG